MSVIDAARSIFYAILVRVRRLERRELRELRRWLEYTPNLLHVSVLVFVPLVIGLVTAISNSVSELSFLLFPPLASGAYTLFADPESPYSSPKRFVGGLTAGAFCGWISLVVSNQYWYAVSGASFEVHAGAATAAIFLTVLVTWLLDLEVPTAFSTALLVLVTGTDQFTYVVSVALASIVVAGVAVLWRRELYEERDRYLYTSTHGDDHVLVPMRDPELDGAVATFAASIASAHAAGKVVLHGIAEDDASADAGGRVAHRLEREAQRLQERFDVPVEVLVTTDTGSRSRATVTAAHDANCDLIVVPYEEKYGVISGSVRSLFAADLDVIALRTQERRDSWNRVLVPVRRAGDVAHLLLDLADRVVRGTGSISVCHCIDYERQRRAAEEMLSSLVKTEPAVIETRVAREPIATYLEKYSGYYDLVVIGASTDRSAASRLISRPLFEIVGDVDCDVAIVHRAGS